MTRRMIELQLRKRKSPCRSARGHDEDSQNEGLKVMRSQRHTHVAFLCSLLFLLSLLSGVGGQIVRSGHFLDDDTFIRCKEDANQADANSDLMLDSDEYVQFINIFSEQQVQPNTLQEVPIILLMAYNWVACFCSLEEGTPPTCCVGDNAHVPLDNSTQTQEYLLLFCAQTEHGLEELLGSEEPSVAPMGMPTISPIAPVMTLLPTLATTGVPTISPIAPAVSLLPTPGVVTTAPSDGPSIAAVSSRPSVQASEIPSLSPTGMPVSSEPSSLTPVSSSPSVQGSDRPSQNPSLMPIISDTQGPSGVPSFEVTLPPTVLIAPTLAPAEASSSPTIVASFAPSGETLKPTVAGLLCINFQYSLRNEAGLMADEIYNEEGNTLRTGLESATGITVTDILNTTFPSVREAVLGNMFQFEAPKVKLPDLTIPTPEWDVFDALSDGKPMPDALSSTREHGWGNHGWDRRLHGRSDSTSIVEHATISALGSMYDEETVADWLHEWRQPKVQRTRRKLHHPYHRSERRLVFYTDEIPAKIISMTDAPLVLCPEDVDTQFSRCTVVGSTVCVQLALGDDADEVRTTIIAGLGEAIDSGEFQENIPPEHRPSEPEPPTDPGPLG